MKFLESAMTALGNKISGKETEITDADNQPDEDKKIVTYVRESLIECRNAGSRVANEGVWMTNYAYLIGYDSVYYDTNTRNYRTSSNSTRVNKLTVNKILPTVQRRQARLCKNAPKWEVRPDKASQEAKDRARLEEQILLSYVERERLLDKRSRMMSGLQQCGHYYMGVTWDTNKGDMMQNPATKESIYEGDIEVSLVSPFEVFPDPLATTLEECRYVTIAKIRKLDYFRTHFPERGMLVKEEDAWLMSAQNELRINSMVGQNPGMASSQNQSKNSAIEMTRYERPSLEHPKGRMIICANGVLLEDKELPCSQIPLVMFCDIQITDKYYPEAIVTHLRPIQDQYNNLIRKRAQWTNLLLAGKYMLPKGSNLQQEALNNQSGEVLYYNMVPGAPAPMAMQVPVIPSYAYEEEDRLNAMFYDIAGDSDISRGVLPAAGIPAIGMQLLLEQDETRISAMTEQHEWAFSKLGGLILEYVEKYSTNERLLKIADPNAQYIVKSYRGTDIKSKHDVICVRGSLAPQNKATRRNDIINLFQQGLYGDPNDPQVRSRVLRDLEFGDTASIWADQAADSAQINKSITEIEQGIAPEVSEFDNHAMHLQEKNKYRKSDKFTNLGPDRQAIMLADMEDHLKWLGKITAPQFGMTVSPEDQVEPEAAEGAQVMDDRARDTALADMDAVQVPTLPEEAP